MNPDVNIRAFQKWSTSGDEAADYNFAQIERYHERGIAFIGGGTASVIFRDEFASDGIFDDLTTRDANNLLVPHDYIVPGARRGSMTNPTFRKEIVDYCKLQIDGGVDGLFLDEVNGGFSGGCRTTGTATKDSTTTPWPISTSTSWISIPTSRRRTGGQTSG